MSKLTQPEKQDWCSWMPQQTVNGSILVSRDDVSIAMTLAIVNKCGMTVHLNAPTGGRLNRMYSSILWRSRHISAGHYEFHSSGVCFEYSSQQNHLNNGFHCMAGYD